MLDSLLTLDDSREHENAHSLIPNGFVFASELMRKSVSKSIDVYRKSKSYVNLGNFTPTGKSFI